MQLNRSTISSALSNTLFLALFAHVQLNVSTMLLPLHLQCTTQCFNANAAYIACLKCHPMRFTYRFLLLYFSSFCLLFCVTPPNPSFVWEKTRALRICHPDFDLLSWFPTCASKKHQSLLIHWCHPSEVSFGKK